MLLWDLMGDLGVSPVLSLAGASIPQGQPSSPALGVQAADGATVAQQAWDTVWVLGTLLQPCWQPLEIPASVLNHPSLACTLVWRRKPPTVPVL